MRPIREIYQKCEEGLYPCQHPQCREYGNLADRNFGIVCKGHSAR
jgi:hypothetical protein